MEHLSIILCVVVVYLNSASKRRQFKIRCALLWQLNGFHKCTVVRNRCHVQGPSRTVVTWAQPPLPRLKPDSQAKPKTARHRWAVNIFAENSRLKTYSASTAQCPPSATTQQLTPNYCPYCKCSNNQQKRGSPVNERSLVVYWRLYKYKSGDRGAVPSTAMPHTHMP